jgi:hypothetical protein
MSKPRNFRKSTTNATTSPLITIMRELVIPAIERVSACENAPSGIDIEELDPESSETPTLCALIRGQYVVQVCPMPVDNLRTNIRFTLIIGYLIADGPSDALLIGNLLDPTPFHVRTDCDLGLYGRLAVTCDLIVRADDGALIERRFGELLQLADDLNWFFPLRLPHHLDWREINEFEIDWNELPHCNLGGFLDEGLESPPAERTPVTLLRLAQGLRRWQDVLQLLREHPKELPRKKWAPLKCLALRQLRRWMPAIRAAKDGGIRDGRYPDAKSLSPSYMHALIEGGDDIEALRLLGNPRDGEPGFYHWLRGLALHHAGDHDQASMAFSEYLAAWPGDVLGGAASQELTTDRE